jgi:hypothetical protein
VPADANSGVIRPPGYAPDAAYLPREVFFGRLALAGAFFSVWASDFGRFFPATSSSFHLIERSGPNESTSGSDYSILKRCSARRFELGLLLVVRQVSTPRCLRSTAAAATLIFGVKGAQQRVPPAGRGQCSQRAKNRGRRAVDPTRTGYDWRCRERR